MPLFRGHIRRVVWDGKGRGMNDRENLETMDDAGITGRKDAVVVVQGPTASGKSKLAIAIAKAFRGAVVNADSLQLYAGLEVITDRPGEADMDGVPHYLFGVMDPSEQGTVAAWLDKAVEVVHRVRADGYMPVVVGGTGMYVRALTQGLTPIPEIPERIRREARTRLNRIGGESFLKELKMLDPVAAGRLPAGDGQRLLRAYEVVRATGKTLSEWGAERKSEPAVDARFLTIALAPPRTAIYAAIDRRFDEMMAAGALEEVRILRALNLNPELTAMKAVGVRELSAYLDGETSLKDAVDAAKRSTRNYAKRQLTWLRTQTAEDVRVVSEQFSESLTIKIFPFIRRFLLTSRT